MVARRTRKAPREQDLSRIRSFSDGVLAISITLLVLNLDVPELSDRLVDELPAKLFALAPDLLSYALGFAVIGRFWIVHHRVLGLLSAWDGRLMALNLIFLAFVGLIPFTSDLLARYGDQPTAVVIYAAVISAASLTSWAMTLYAKRSDLVRPSAAESARPYGTVRALLIPGVFLLSIPLAFLSPYAAEALWVTSFFVHPTRSAPQASAA